METHRFGGPWTVEKLDALRAYLIGYAQALKNQPFRRWYIDAFAGTGDRAAKRQEAASLLEIPELDVMTKGSARVALEIEPPFDRYIFIEKRRRRSSALEHLKSEFPNCAIEILNEDANAAVQRICRDTDWRSNRAVLFLDPYGMQVSWETLVAVASTKAIDLWMLYPSGMGLNRLFANTSPVSRGRAHAREVAGNQRPWPADKVERWSIDRLIPYAKNARTHTDAQVAAIAASIKEWGWTSPALVGEDGGLIAGHARVLAARQLGIAKIPVMVAAGWSEAQKRAYVLADNQLAITGSGWDPELLRLELGELKLSGFDLSLTGFGGTGPSRW